ncbi:MAG: hypothetical protein KatS3mg131_0537 [Candidatus Tectimicrobiota bacterium]|nr:MAG: hypothetical protein KatS3mg131_0537 [Candidatus Tectomicrobia bacterium]
MLPLPAADRLRHTAIRLSAFLMHGAAAAAIFVSLMATPAPAGPPANGPKDGEAPRHRSEALVLAQQVTSPAPEHYRYDPEGRRDPFESLVKEQTPVELQRLPRENGRPRGPLERYDLSALQLVGIVWGGLGRLAIIRAPDGKGYFVRVGTYVGENGGRVVAIEDDRLVLEERYVDAEGNIVPKTLTIPLRRQEEKG